HLTGHADHRPDGPRFLTESASGAPEWVSAADIAREVPRRPRLTFLSGCRTGQSLAAGAVPSLAEELLALGFPALLRWGRPGRGRDGPGPCPPPRGARPVRPPGRGLLAGGGRPARPRGPGARPGEALVPAAAVRGRRHAARPGRPAPDPAPQEGAPPDQPEA